MSIEKLIKSLCMNDDITPTDEQLFTPFVDKENATIQQIDDMIRTLYDIDMKIQKLDKNDIEIKFTHTIGRNDINIYTCNTITNCTATILIELGYKLRRMIVNNISIKTDHEIDNIELRTLQETEYNKMDWQQAISIGIDKYESSHLKHKAHLKWLESEITQ